ncbi:hypothetical protein ASD44_13990 [Mesorhizobium sp. Root554]|uniref:DUF805 domain-containing protein n=1 Tax=unclassified Mesorhizobium TaxID=325217 RepID=UPI0006FB8AE8|nr:MULTISPECIES: DUF805 domain-containing protein [unclassified Mesorhizobium]KQZ15044.1 hypothetical protein ASD27_13995 [Mesorhizobium sp. Root1471]KQZ37554.1 hypothetical protein ASD44_13990 [Mesorhizobium sp. Root554]
MRGEVLYYDESQGFGFVHADDGERYTFTREDLRREATVGQGTLVEFQPNGGRARDILILRAQIGASTPDRHEEAATQPAGAQSAAHFGRLAMEDERQSSASLPGYFWRALTTNYVNFAGRARRKEYWGYALFWLIGFTVLLIAGLLLDVSTGSLDSGQDLPIATFGIVGTFTVATFFPGIALMARRLHDIGLSGWLVLVVVIPLGWLVMLVFALVPTQKRENRWGPIPEGVTPTPTTPPDEEAVY